MGKSSIALVDANIWIAALDKDDSTHKQADALISKIFQNQEVVLSALVVQEVMSVFMRKGHVDLAWRFYDLARAHKKIRLLGVDQEWLDATATLLGRIKPRKALSYTDYSLIAMALEFGIELVSFDKKLIHAYRYARAA